MPEGRAPLSVHSTTTDHRAVHTKQRHRISDEYPSRTVNVKSNRTNVKTSAGGKRLFPFAYTRRACNYRPSEKSVSAEGLRVDTHVTGIMKSFTGITTESDYEKENVGDGRKKSSVGFRDTVVFD